MIMKKLLKRIEKFYEDTAEVISYFSEQGKLIRVNADAPINKIQDNIVKALEVSDLKK